MSPRELAEKVQKMSAVYSRLSEELGVAKGEYAEQWLLTRNQCSTDKETDRMMAASASGRLVESLTGRMKGYEKEMSADKAMLRVMENEARNLI